MTTHADVWSSCTFKMPPWKDAFCNFLVFDWDWNILEGNCWNLTEPLQTSLKFQILKSMPTKATMYNTCNFQPLLHNHHFSAHAQVLLLFMQPDWLSIRLFRPWLGLIGSLGSYFVISTIKICSATRNYRTMVRGDCLVKIGKFHAVWPGDWNDHLLVAN
jgi:hypothetical protein